ncbi:MAG TPA: ATP-binding protein [Acidobacteriaceae bacterium]|nr:ATP-binding protein [Acidobacteriaceae bacterium]
MKRKLLLSWSSGKDSAWALHCLQRSGEYELVGLLTTLNAAFDRVAMHSTRRALLEAQANAAGLPLHLVPLPWPCSNEQYEAAMQSACDAAVAEGIAAIAFGDLFLEDIRRYREDRLKGTGLEPIFPVWGLDTRFLAEEMVASGLRARIVCVDPRKLPAEFAGRDFDAAFVRDLPAGVDPCGENGEFHTAVYAGPMFREAIPIEGGEIVQRDGFVFADVCLAEAIPAQGRAR